MTISSCQVVEDSAAVKSASTFKVTAAAPQATRISYTVKEDGGAFTGVSQAWEVGDVITIMDDTRRFAKFTVESVDANGVATFNVGDYTPEQTKDGEIVNVATQLAAVYYPAILEEKSGWSTSYSYSGKDTTFNFHVPFDLTEGLTGKLTDKPRIPLKALAEIVDNTVTFTFDNVGSVVAVTGLKAAPNATITSVRLSGLAVSGNVKYDVQADPKTFEFKSGSKGNLEIALTEPLVCDASGNCATTLYFPVLPSEATEVAVYANTAAGDTYVNKFNVTEVKSGVLYYMTRELKIMDDFAAEVDGKKCATIDDAAAAVRAAENDCVVKLLADLTLETGVIFQNNNGKKLTLDLNDHSIIGNGASPLVTVKNTNVEFKGGPENKGTIKNTGARALYISAESSSAKITATFNGGYYTSDKITVYAGGKSGDGTLYADVYVNEGTTIETTSDGSGVYALQLSGSTVGCSANLHMAGGLILAEYTTKGYAIRLSGNGTHEITGGKAVAAGTVVYAQNSSKLTVTGGYFEGAFSKTSANVFELKGGHYAWDNMDKLATFVPAGYKVATSKETGYYYTIVAE